MLNHNKEKLERTDNIIMLSFWQQRILSWIEQI